MSGSARDEVRELLDRVLAAPESEREALLAEALADGGPVAEVRRLLADEEELEDLLDTVGPARPDRGGPSGRSHSGPGSIGPYRIVGLLGEGGMGTVYLAEQTRPVERQVAVKVLRVADPRPEHVARFLAEQEAMARLDHPHVVQLLDAGTTADGRPYFVQQLVDGQPITEYSDAHRLPVEERLRLFVDVCRGAEHAHQNFVLHRDLKPANVLVAEVDGRPVPKIIDFGIVKWLDAEEGPDMTGDRLIGTPTYMSPEALGHGGQVDTRSDVFSLGVLLYELIAGVRPWTVRARSGIQALEERRGAEARRPSTQLTDVDSGELRTIASRRRVEPETLGRRLRGDLDWIVMKAIDPDPERRYGSAVGLAADLERLLRDEPVTARPPTAAYLLRKLIVRHRAAVATGLVVLVLGAIGTAWGFLDARRAERRARAEARAAVAARNEARQVSEFLTGLFGASAVDRQGADRPPSEITALDLLEEGSERIRTELADQPLAAARLEQTLANVYRELGLYDTTLEHADSALARLEGLEAGRPEVAALRARALRERMVALHHQGSPVEARRALEAARAAGELGFEGEELDRFRADVLIESARLRRREGRFEQAERELLEARDLLEDLGEVGRGRVTLWSQLGTLAFSQGQWDVAEDRFRRALELASRQYSEGHPIHSRLLQSLGAAVASQGRLDEAAPIFEQVLAAQQRMLGERHPNVAASLNNLGQLNGDRGRPEEAEAFHRRALEIREEALGEDNPSTAWSLDNLARTVADLDRLDEARELQRRALAARRASLGAEHPEIARSLEHLGSIARRQGDLPEAEKLLREALAIRERALGPDDGSLVDTALDLAEVLVERGRAGEAATWLDRAEAILGESGDPEDREERERAGQLRARL